MYGNLNILCRRVSVLTTASISFGLIPRDHWYQPNWIDEAKAKESRDNMVEKNIIYGGSVSYRNMCRFNSGVRIFFARCTTERDANPQGPSSSSNTLRCSRIVGIGALSEYLFDSRFVQVRGLSPFYYILPERYAL